MEHTNFIFPFHKLAVFFQWWEYYWYIFNLTSTWVVLLLLLLNHTHTTTVSAKHFLYSFPGDCSHSSNRPLSPSNIPSPSLYGLFTSTTMNLQTLITSITSRRYLISLFFLHLPCLLACFPPFFNFNIPPFLQLDHCFLFWCFFSGFIYLFYFLCSGFPFSSTSLLLIFSMVPSCCFE